MKPKKVFSVPGAPLEIRWSLKPRRQLGDHRHGAHLEALAGQAGRRRRVAGQGRRHHRRSGQDPAARRHQHHARRQGAVGQHLHGRQDALLRPDQSRGAEADLREGDRQAGQHDLAELGRQARLHHLVAARQLGQGRRRQRAVPARLRLGRQGAEADVRGGLHQGEARPRAPHEARLQGAASRRDGARRCALALALARAGRRAPAPATRRRRCPRSTSSRPRPGTYTLHRIMAAPDGEVLGIDGRPQRLSRFTRERITLLGFIYTTCVDPEGCPLAYRVFDALRESIAATPALREQGAAGDAVVRPRARHAVGDAAVRGQPRERRRPAACRWYFLTTALGPRADAAGRGLRPGRPRHRRPVRAAGPGASSRTCSRCS